jgi:hypothetical protein
VLLKNESSTKFITDHQPAINTYAFEGTGTENFEIYYPVAPHLAVRLTEKPIINRPAQSPSQPPMPLAIMTRLHLWPTNSYLHLKLTRMWLVVFLVFFAIFANLYGS